MTTRCGASSPAAPSDNPASPVAPKRTRRWLVLTLLTLLPLGFLLARSLRADFAPQVSLTVLGQEWTNRVNFTYRTERSLDHLPSVWSDRDTPSRYASVTYAPNEPRPSVLSTNTQMILVRVRIRNEGDDSVAQFEYRGCGYFLEVRIGERWLSYSTEESSFGSVFDLVGPAESRDLIVQLPPETTAWRLSWTAQSASLNYRARWHLVQRRMSDIPAGIASWLLGPLEPAYTGHVLKSPAIPVEIGATPREPSPLQITEDPLSILQYRATARKKVRTPPRPVHASSPPAIPAPHPSEAPGPR